MTLTAVLAAAWWFLRGASPEVAPPVDGLYSVDRVIDGDTLLLTSGQRVRLQGIDTPETVHPGQPVERWGPEASAHAKRFVDRADGQVQLLFGAERIDRYGRWLAFVWHEQQMLNEELVRAGLAEAKLGYRYAGRMKRRLRAAQDEARKAARGLWSPASPIRVTAAGAPSP